MSPGPRGRGLRVAGVHVSAAIPLAGIGCTAGRGVDPSAAWSPGEFSLTWSGDSVRAGILPAR